MPLVATNVGALVGTLIYVLMIEVHHLEPGPSSEPSGLDLNAEGKHVVKLEGEPDLKYYPKELHCGTAM